jgi:YidC/Oxa1 family membrane protein insertase
MDRKSIIVIAACVVLMLIMPKLANNIFPPRPLPPGATNIISATANPPGTNAPGAPGAPNTPSTPGPVPPAPVPSAVVTSFTTNTEEQTLTVTNRNARYIFTSRGGGLKEIQLVQYPESVSTLRKTKSNNTVAVATLNHDAPVPVLALLDDGTAEGDGIFTLAQTADGVRATKVLAGGLTVVKDFEISSNYLITATVRLENHGAQALALPARELVIGTATPLGVQDKGMYINATWYDGVRMNPVGVTYFSTNTTVLGFFQRVPKTEYRAASTNLLWATVQNQFFTIVAMPETPAPEMVVRPVELLPDPNAPADPFVPRGAQASLAFASTNLPPGKACETKISIYAGPKEYRRLARLAEDFNNNVDLVMGYGGFFGGISRALLLAMNWIHDFLRLPYGWAIIAITVIIKLVFWPLTSASTKSMKRMQALQPQMKAIAEKYKDDAVKKNQKTMEFMREHKVNPMGGCLPMVIQLPIFIGFYRMIQSAIELRGAPFLWIGDLSRPDTVFTFPGLGFVPIIGIPGVGLPINILPLIMGVTQVWQAHLTPASPTMDASQQKMMKYMPLMMMLILYNFSAGLTLYWTSQTLLTIVQTKLTKTNPNDPLLALHPKKGK